MFKSEFDRGVEVIHEIFHELELFGCACEDHEDVIYESLPERDCPDEDFPDGFLLTTHEEVGNGGAALVPMAVLTSWRKCLSMNEGLLFFRMASINAPIV